MFLWYFANVGKISFSSKYSFNILNSLFSGQGKTLSEFTCRSLAPSPLWIPLHRDLLPQFSYILEAPNSNLWLVSQQECHFLVGLYPSYIAQARSVLIEKVVKRGSHPEWLLSFVFLLSLVILPFPPKNYFLFISFCLVQSLWFLLWRLVWYNLLYQKLEILFWSYFYSAFYNVWYI